MKSTKRNKVTNIFIFIMLHLIITFGTALTTHAATDSAGIGVITFYSNSTNNNSDEGNYAREGGKWVLDQIFWVATVAIIILVLKLAIARNIVAAISTVVVGGIVLFLIKSPETIQTIGNLIAGKIGLSG